jgi:hypothetical protein
MNEEKVINVVNKILIDKVNQLLEEVTTNEFLERVSNEVWDEWEEPTDFDEEGKIKEIIKEKIFPKIYEMSKHLY